MFLLDKLLKALAVSEFSGSVNARYSKEEHINEYHICGLIVAALLGTPPVAVPSPKVVFVVTRH